MRQLLAETDSGEVSNMEELQASMEKAPPLYFPEEHKREFEVVDNDAFVGHVLECYVYKMVSKGARHPFTGVGQGRDSILGARLWDLIERL